MRKYHLALKTIAISVVVFAALTSERALAQQGVTTLVRMPRVSAMGGAGVGLADDEFALFLNPAGLAGQETRRFKIIGIGIEAPLETITTLSTSIAGMTNFNLSTLNQLMGKEIFLRTSVVPIFQLPHFAITYFADAQGAIEQFNQANPTFKLGDMITHGVQAGMGWSFKSGRRAKDEWRFGLAAKMLYRRGGYFDNVSMAQVVSGGRAYIDSLVGTFGTGYGVDAGIQYVNHLNRNEDLLAGASVTDIGGIKFPGSNSQGVQMNPSLGIAYKRKTDFMDMKVAFDIRNLDQSIAFVNKTHFGTEFSLRVLDFYAGLNQLNPTYGVAFDLWVLRVSAMSFAEELGVVYHQMTSQRYMLQIDFSLPI